MTDETLHLAKELIRRPSVTPDDAGCQRLIHERLAGCGFGREAMDCGEVVNSWMRRGGAAPLLVFAGHTDVVPAGDGAGWKHPPFDATEDGGLLYGRGSADMKGGLAAMVCACRRFAEAHPRHRGSIALLLTSDEEGAGRDGTRHVMDTLLARGERIAWCVVGEPSSEEHLGDTIKHGRRGSLSASLTIRGKQGHVAYPHLARNPIHLAAPLLAKLCAQQWDGGNRDFPPTTFQVSAVRAGAGADNVIPGDIRINFNFRFSPETGEDELKRRVAAMIEAEGLDCRIEWRLSGLPFITAHGELLVASREAVREVTGREPRLSTGGGTSDARFIAPHGIQTIELGPVNASIHQVDEHVAAADLGVLADIYLRLAEKLLLH
ncbi:MAG: succinyl-diaminopimelate desuccinylase [Gammaproteobacteria bacterium]|nr:succinyl-diaminopimelate desuccinylase [Gammaproteobacteria bacterium]